jgi:hypothetical protein
MRDDMTVAPDDLGRVEYVIESRTGNALETWLVVRPGSAGVPRFAALGLSVSPGARVVVDAASLRPVGVLDANLPPPSSPAGFNPYFDLPAA